MKPASAIQRCLRLWMIALAICTSSGLLHAKAQSCCNLQTTRNLPVAQAQDVDSGPQNLQVQNLSGSDRTPLQQVEWRRLAQLAGPACTDETATGAARRQTAEAAWVIGLLYLHGIGVPADPALARQCFMQAWGLGLPLASAGMAWCAIEGCAQPPQPAQAQLWLDRLEPVAPARTLYLRWWLTNLLAPLPHLQAGQSPMVSTSLHSDWLESAAQRGDTQAQIEMGLLQASLLKWPEALRWFDMASRSSATARSNAQRVRQQLQHQEDASRLGTDMAQADPDVLYRQARRYHQGDGIPANYAQALLLYQLAAAKSSGPAQRMLNLIYSRPNALGGVDILWMQQLADADVSGPQVRWPRTRTSRALTRDPTALFDYVPDLWKPQP